MTDEEMFEYAFQWLKVQKADHTNNDQIIEFIEDCLFRLEGLQH